MISSFPCQILSSGFCSRMYLVLCPSTCSWVWPCLSPCLFSSAERRCLHPGLPQGCHVFFGAPSEATVGGFVDPKKLGNLRLIFDTCRVNQPFRRPWHCVMPSPASWDGLQLPSDSAYHVALTDVNTALHGVLVPNGMSEFFTLSSVPAQLFLREGVKVPDHLQHLPNESPQLQATLDASGLQCSEVEDDTSKQVFTGLQLDHKTGVVSLEASRISRMRGACCTSKTSYG